MKTKTYMLLLLLLVLLLPVFTPLPVAAASCDGGGDSVELSVDVGDCQGGENVIFSYLSAIIRFVAAGVGMVLVLLIIIAGIRWVTSSGNPQALASAQKLLLAAVVGLLAFIFSVAIINYLIPGGVISL